MKFSDRVKSLRIQKGYTQCELAELTNISQPALQAYEAGKAKPLKNNAIQLAKVLGVSYEELVSDEASVISE